VLIGASPASVRRALWHSNVWIRAARAAGGRLEVAGASPTLKANGLLRFRPRRIVPSLLLAVGETAGLPTLESVKPWAGSDIRVRLLLAPTAAGTTATVEFLVRTPSRWLGTLLRRALSRYGRTLLGITTLAAREPVRVVAAALIADGMVLLARRSSTGAQAGRWELPGGKVDTGETDRQALQRELKEELGVEVAIAGRIGPAVDVEPGIVMLCYRGQLPARAEVVLTDHDEYRWVNPVDLGTVDLLEPDRRLIQSLRIALQAPP
jgi:8-oxo-dGTP diphosphatase